MLELLVAALAVWRLSSLFARERGPGNLFGRIRILASRSDELIAGLTCMWCNSIWFGAMLSVLFSGTLMEWIEHTLAVSAMSILFETIMEALNGNRKD